jgi:hypothetical protein
VVLLKGTSVQTELNKDGKEAVKEATGTFQQVEKAKWTITKETSGSTVSYTAASTADTDNSMLRLYKTDGQSTYYGWNNEVLFVTKVAIYQKSMKTVDDKKQATGVSYGICYTENLDSPTSMYYNRMTYENGNSIETTADRLYISIRYSQSLNESQSAVEHINIRKIYVFDGSYEEVNAAIKALNQGTADADIPNCVTYVFSVANDQSDNNQSGWLNTTCTSVLGTDEMIAAVKTKLIDLYKGTEQITEDSTNAEVIQALETYFREEVGTALRTEVDNVLALYE